MHIVIYTLFILVYLYANGSKQLHSNSDRIPFRSTTQQYHYLFTLGCFPPPVRGNQRELTIDVETKGYACIYINQTKYIYIPFENI